MMYHIAVPDPNSRFVEISCTAPVNGQQTLEFQLPAWRPGRYEIQNFAKNIQKFSARSSSGADLRVRKLTKDRWQVDTNPADEQVIVSYNFYAAIQNAGSSYVDEDLWYLNFINFALYAEGQLEEYCQVTLDLPEGFRIACGLTPTEQPNVLHAGSYYQLVDCPLLASATLQHETYEEKGVNFHVWMHGNLHPNWRRIRNDFARFSFEQIAMMGDFPEKEYHFINLILPTAFYHGVEHFNSTMIVLGPDDEGEGLYTDLLGVSSHELFHAWNIIRIRPIELLPYDFTKENYFTTCFVAEGCTTYYGDLFLRRAHVFDDQAYIKELQVYMKRHFENSGKAAQSLIESSWDLWLDGYEKGIPQRKVSVYHKGALVALILDLFLRKKFDHARSLDDVMRQLWQRFGKPFIGYTYADYQSIVREIADDPLDWYWNDCIEGNLPLEEYLNEALGFVGLQMTTFTNGNIQLHVREDARANRQWERWLAPVEAYETSEKM
ncbi:M61 family metallopeptidase [Arundinibacter roseus]|uniref:M61 family peptidase n=1 Tax=Arundinibacter roseus TaxID=2070510 RepID=A0A4R4KBC6_9BACT|nr:M61 family metallopeptidase [Arundinibacter roseus]TDB63771.1 M61 family peptidase [Arundinibacter roseus]